MDIKDGISGQTLRQRGNLSYASVRQALPSTRCDERDATEMVLQLRRRHAMVRVCSRMRIVGVRRAWFTKIFAERAAIIDMPFQLLPATLLYQSARAGRRLAGNAVCTVQTHQRARVPGLRHRIPSRSVWALPLGP